MEGLTVSQSAPDGPYEPCMIILHLWGMRARRILKRAREEISNEAPWEPIVTLSAMRQWGNTVRILQGSCPLPSYCLPLEGSARTGARRVNTPKRLFTQRFHLAIFILMNAERPCKKVRCLSAASERSEQLPEGTLERARSSRLKFVFWRGSRPSRP